MVFFLGAAWPPVPGKEKLVGPLQGLFFARRELFEFRNEMSPPPSGPVKKPVLHSSTPSPARRGLWASYEGARTTLARTKQGSHVHLTPIALPKQTRLRFGIGLGVVGIIGMIVSDRLEEKFPVAQPGPASA